MREKPIVKRDGQAQERAQAKLERNRRWFGMKKSTFLVRQVTLALCFQSGCLFLYSLEPCKVFSATRAGDQVDEGTGLASEGHGLVAIPTSGQSELG